ncbi:MAG: sirohydrochlorin chelatase [Gemmatimonadales bacterium]
MRRALRVVGILGLFIWLVGFAQDGKGVVGTIIVAHGGDSAWNARVLDLAREVRTGGPVEASFLMGPAARTTRFQDAVARLERAGAQRIVVVPLLISSYSGHYEQARYLGGETDSLDATMLHHLRSAGIERAAAKIPVQVTRALDDALELAAVLADRALALGGDPRSGGLMLVAHGPNSPEDHAAWMRSLRAVADTVKARTGYRDVRVGLLRDDAPAPVRAEAVRAIRDVIELQHLATGGDVAVVPVLISSGAISRSKLPQDLEGLPVQYSGAPLLPHPAMARWVERRVARSLPRATQER